MYPLEAVKDSLNHALAEYPHLVHSPRYEAPEIVDGMLVFWVKPFHVTVRQFVGGLEVVCTNELGVDFEPLVRFLEIGVAKYCNLASVIDTIDYEVTKFDSMNALYALPRAAYVR